MPEIYVLTWRYFDNSGHGVVRAFASEADAQDLQALLAAHSESRVFEVEPTPFQEATED